MLAEHTYTHTHTHTHTHNTHTQHTVDDGSRLVDVGSL